MQLRIEAQAIKDALGDVLGTCRVAGCAERMYMMARQL